VYQRTDSRILEPSHGEEYRGWLCIRVQTAGYWNHHKERNREAGCVSEDRQPATGTITRRGVERLAVYQRTDSRLLEPSHGEEYRGWLCTRGQTAGYWNHHMEKNRGWLSIRGQTAGYWNHHTERSTEAGCVSEDRQPAHGTMTWGGVERLAVYQRTDSRLLEPSLGEE
jgi:hypothetical protein